MIIEPDLAYYAALRRKDEELKEISDFLDGKMDRQQYENYSKYFESTYIFHLMVAKAAKNEIMEKFLGTIFEQIKQADALSFIVEKHIYTNQVGHRNILKAIEEKDAEKAKQLMYEHIYPVYAFFQD